MNLPHPWCLLLQSSSWAAPFHLLQWKLSLLVCTSRCCGRSCLVFTSMEIDWQQTTLPLRSVSIKEKSLTILWHVTETFPELWPLEFLDSLSMNGWKYDFLLVTFIRLLYFYAHASINAPHLYYERSVSNPVTMVCTYLIMLFCVCIHLLCLCRHVFHIIRPSRAPGFAYSWLELISHRTFIAKLLLQTTQQKVCSYGLWFCVTFCCFRGGLYFTNCW